MLEKSNDLSDDDQTIIDYYKSTVEELEKQGVPMDEILKRLDDMVNMNNFVQYHITLGSGNSWLA